MEQEKPYRRQRGRVSVMNKIYGRQTGPSSYSKCWQAREDPCHFFHGFYPIPTMFDEPLPMCSLVAGQILQDLSRNAWTSHQKLGKVGWSRVSSSIHVSGETGWYRFSVLATSNGCVYGGDNWMVERRDLAGMIGRRFFLSSTTRAGSIWLLGRGYQFQSHNGCISCAPFRKQSTRFPFLSSITVRASFSFTTLSAKNGRLFTKTQISAAFLCR